ncbi:hypothetical protein DNTS_026337 [Danionella cerebrum]|uniref:GAIN-B domain-containing protein n=1 Tax=Danionella cerebrum TaxID=2873325 RepID=A0A553QWJ8_9TELE|nr:hypothetical protein DNTS_026337 [Danionella translucida]
MFANHYQGSVVQGLVDGICQVIVKLDTEVDLCSMLLALENIFGVQRTVSFDGYLSRVGKCFCYDPSLDPLLLPLMWQPSLSANFTPEIFCVDSSKENQTFCIDGASVVIPLNGTCNASTDVYGNYSTAPPFYTITPPSNKTTVNTVNSTVSPVNGTIAATTVATTTSGPVDADALLGLSANASSLNASQVDKILSQLESLLSGPNVSLDLANTSVGIVNNLLDVPAAVITSFSKRAVGVVDTVGFKLVVTGASQSLLSQSLSVAVKKVDGANFQETSFSLTDSSNLQIRSNPSVKSSRVALSGPLGSVTLPSFFTQNLSAEQQQRASRDKSLGDRKLISGILGTTVGNLSISGLQKEVLITLQNTGAIPVNSVASCVFWNFSLNGGSGGWSSSGCRVVNSSAENTVCACNHLTSFGILLDISKTEIPPEQLIILTYITYIGCGISAIFLSVTLLTYLAFG